MNPSYWLNDHQKHCQSLKLKNDFVKRNIAKASLEARKLFLSHNKNQADIDCFIHKEVLRRIEQTLLNSKRLGLLCSGGEDSIYLLTILVKNLEIKPKLFCYQTKNNISDIKRLKKIANIFNLKLFLYDKSNLNRYGAYKKFLECQKRKPNDIAQPVHNALYIQAVEKHHCDIVIDGQFCDTVLLSNPQNHFLFWAGKYPKFLKYSIRLLSFLPYHKDSKINSRLKYLNDLLSTFNPTEHIFKLINLQNPDKELIETTEALIKEFGIQLTFSMFFFYCLLTKRERDKYLLCPKMLSPFDDFKLAILANANLEQVLGFFIRKKPIRNLCKKYFPKFFRFQNSLPFELE